MITPIFRILMIILGFGLLSCSSSKFKYRDAYKFGSYNYGKTTPEAAGQSEEPYFEPLASTSPNFDPVMTARPAMTIPKADPITRPSAKIPPKQRRTKLIRNEKKAFRQSLKQQLKEVLKERKTLRKEAKNKKTAMNRKVYSGLIIAGAGIVVAILVSGTIGGLAIIVGVALIAWGLIEEGSI